jgi:hypothetical protein
MLTSTALQHSVKIETSLRQALSFLYRKSWGGELETKLELSFFPLLFLLCSHSRLDCPSSKRKIREGKGTREPLLPLIDMRGKVCPKSFWGMRECCLHIDNFQFVRATAATVGKGERLSEYSAPDFHFSLRLIPAHDCDLVRHYGSSRLYHKQIPKKGFLRRALLPLG